MREMTTAVILGYLVIMNVIAFAAMGVDKSRAKRGAWRIPEKTLFSLSLLGGSIGALAGMYTFRHKTKHLKFVAGMPAVLVCHILLAAVLLYRLAVSG